MNKLMLKFMLAFTLMAISFTAAQSTQVFASGQEAWGECNWCSMQGEYYR